MKCPYCSSDQIRMTNIVTEPAKPSKNAGQKQKERKIHRCLDCGSMFEEKKEETT